MRFYQRAAIVSVLATSVFALSGTALAASDTGHESGATANSRMAPNENTTGSGNDPQANQLGANSMMSSNSMSGNSMSGNSMSGNSMSGGASRLKPMADKAMHSSKMNRMAPTQNTKGNGSTPSASQ